MMSDNVQGAIYELLASIEDIKEYIGYIDKDIAGICVDYQNGTFERLEGAAGKEQGADFDVFPMYGGRKRCTVGNDGTILAYYGDDNYNEDAVTSTGDKVQVMVYQPAFWYRVVPLVLDENTDSGMGCHIRKANYYVSRVKKKGFKLHPAFYNENRDPVDYILFSAYEGSMWDTSEGRYVNDNTDTVAYADDDLLCSVAGRKPISGKLAGIGTIENFEAMAKKRGGGWHLSTIKAEAANQLLMLIELGTMDTQTAIGQGVVTITDRDGYNCSSLTGSTAELGSRTGQAAMTVNEIDGGTTEETEAGKVSVSYRGVENPWGNIWKHINGVNIWGDGTMSGGQVYIADDFNFSTSKHDGNYQAVGFTIPNKTNYINAMGYGKEEYDWLLMPSAISSTAERSIGDYCYVSANLNNHAIVQLGGGCINLSYAGGFSWACYTASQNRARSIGGRLLYVPQNNQM